MNRKQAKEMLPIIQAFAEGKGVETKTGSGWISIENMSFAGNPDSYRIKPEPKYRPFANTEECWEEMQKHQPFGWVIKECEKKILITEVLTYGVNLHRQEACYGFYEANKILTFADGTPFGVKVEK